MLLKRIKEIIRRYVEGTSSTLEQHAIDSWLTKLQNTPSPLTAEQLDHVRNDMWQHIKAPPAHKLSRLAARIHLHWRVVASIAAVLLTGFAISTVVLHKAEVRYQTGPGETKEVILADGSTLKLQENTRLSVSHHYGTDSIRQVNLHEGEAFFDVARDRTRPFVIKNKLMETEVLGTSFTIRSIDALDEWNIRVKTGRVRVSQMNKQDRAYILLADESLAYNREKDIIHYVPSAATVPENLVFESEHLGKVMRKLAKRYNRSIRVPEDIAQAHQFSGEFNEDESFSAVLDMICIATSTQYHLEGDTIVLSQKE